MPGGGVKPACTRTLEGQKALFSYINLQVTDSFGGQNHANFLFGGQCPPCPHACTCLVATLSFLNKCDIVPPEWVCRRRPRRSQAYHSCFTEELLFVLCSLKSALHYVMSVGQLEHITSLDKLYYQTNREQESLTMKDVKVAKAKKHICKISLKFLIANQLQAVIHFERNQLYIR